MWIVMEGGCQGIFHAISEEDLQRILSIPATMIASDGEIPIFGDVPHPAQLRNVRARARPLRPREEAADARNGRAEDVVVSGAAARAGGSRRAAAGPQGRSRRLRSAAFADTATFEKPHSYAAGVSTVIVNGQVVFENGAMTAARPGGSSTDRRNASRRPADAPSTVSAAGTCHGAAARHSHRWPVDRGNAGDDLARAGDRLRTVRRPRSWTPCGRSGGTLAEHRYGPVEGFLELVSYRGEARARERHRGAAGEPRARHGRGQPGVRQCDPGGDRSRRRGHPADAVLLQPRDGDRDRRRVPIGGATDQRVSARRGCDCGGDHATDARGRHRLAEQSDRRGLSRSSARAVNALCRERGVFHIHDEAYGTHLRAARHFSPGSIAGARGTRSRSTRCRRPTGWRAGASATWWCPGAGGGDQQDPGHAAHLPAGGVAARAAALPVGRAYPRQHLAQLDAMRHTIYEALNDPPGALRGARRSPARSTT